jgi:hypothetical protein
MMSMDAWQGHKADKALLGRCRQAIRRVVPDADIILYGSRARGDAGEYSDYDYREMLFHQNVERDGVIVNG